MSPSPAADSRTVRAMGLAVAPPSGWEVAIYRRSPAPGERTYPIVHAATVPIPPARGDYGSGLVEALGPDDVFVAMLEFGPEAAGSALFPSLPGIPALEPSAFRPRQLQRVLRGQAGAQRFMTVAGRAFCLYAVVGSVARRTVLASRANQLIGSLRVEPA